MAADRNYAVESNIMEMILEQNVVAERLLNVTPETFGTKVGILTMLFGCRHKELGRPFTNKKVSYRACTSCGARRKFDTSNFKTLGTFYHPPSVSPQP